MLSTDNEPPKIKCPTKIVTNTSATEAVVSVSWGPPSYSDNSEGVDSTAELRLVSNFQSPREFEIGLHTVNYNVTDNSGRSAQCSFEIEVKGIVHCQFLSLYQSC